MHRAVHAGLFKLRLRELSPDHPRLTTRWTAGLFFPRARRALLEKPHRRPGHNRGALDCMFGGDIGTRRVERGHLRSFCRVALACRASRAEHGQLRSVRCVVLTRRSSLVAHGGLRPLRRIALRRVVLRRVRAHGRSYGVACGFVLTRPDDSTLCAGRCECRRPTGARSRHPRPARMRRPRAATSCARNRGWSAGLARSGRGATQRRTPDRPSSW